jgi:hypothetical protein
MENTPLTLEQAVEGLKNGQFTSLRDAAAKTGFAKSTLRNHQNGVKCRREAHIFEQKLSPELEQHLLEWMLAEDRAGLPLTYASVRSMVNDILDCLGITTGLGKNWIRDFVRRYPAIKIVNQRLIEADRVNACNTKTISAYFDQHSALIQVPFDQNTPKLNSSRPVLAELCQNSVEREQRCQIRSLTSNVVAVSARCTWFEAKYNNEKMKIEALSNKKRKKRK